MTLLLKSLKLENMERTHAHYAYFFICFHIKVILTLLEVKVLRVELSKGNAEMLQNTTQSNNNEACELWSPIRWQVIRTCRWHASSIDSVLSITELLYMRYSPPVLINRCDLTERITHEPSLIRSLFPSDPGDRSSSHIPLTLETL